MKGRAAGRVRSDSIDVLLVVQSLLWLILVVTTPSGARAGDPGSSEYRIGVEHAATSRLIMLGTTVPDPGAPMEKPAPRSRFANQRFSGLIEEAARSTDLDPALVHAVIAVESGYNPAARSVKGAIGLMQVLPATAARYGVPDPSLSPAENLRAGTRYLSYLMALFNNQIELALAAYNAGEYAVLRHGHRIPPYRETQKYVPAVLARYHRWREREPPPAPVAVGIRYMPGTVLQPGAVDQLVYRLGKTPHSGRD